MRDKVSMPAPKLAVSAQIVGLCVALIAAGCSGLRLGTPASGVEGDVPLAPLPTDIDPAGSGPALGRWTLTSFEGDLTVTVTAVGPLCSNSVAAHPPLLDGSYLQLDQDGALRFVLKWESSTDRGFTYDYADRAGAQSSWSWPEGVEGSTPLGTLLVYGPFLTATDLRGGWEIASQDRFVDCRQQNSGIGSWQAIRP
ncbi:MAG TPA: hypothetical protein VGA32_00650 [Anaerolineales bacterium]